MSFILILFFTKSSRVNLDKQPSSRENGCPLGLGDSLIHVAQCIAHSVLCSVDNLPVVAMAGGRGRVCSHHGPQGRMKHVLRSPASHQQLCWTRKIITNIQAAQTLAPNTPPALGSISHASWTRLPASVTKSQLTSLRCQDISGILTDKQKEDLTKPKAQVSMLKRTSSLAPRGPSGKAKVSSKPRTNVYFCLSIFHHTWSFLQ